MPLLPFVEAYLRLGLGRHHAEGRLVGRGVDLGGVGVGVGARVGFRAGAGVGVRVRVRVGSSAAA